MLRINDITYAVEGRTLFEGASASIPEGHKVGVVGRNGTGKTTLFRLIRGELVLEGGSITLPARARIGGVRQEVPSSEVSLLDTVLEARVLTSEWRHYYNTARPHSSLGYRPPAPETKSPLPHSTHFPPSRRSRCCSSASCSAAKSSSVNVRTCVARS